METYTENRIIEVINRYFASLDDKHLSRENMARIFSEDAKLIRPNGAITEGPQAIADSHAGSFSRFRATQHIASGFIITAASDTEAHFRANITAMHLGRRVKAIRLSTRTTTISWPEASLQAVCDRLEMAGASPRSLTA